MRAFRTGVLRLAAALACSTAAAAVLTREQALMAIEHPEAITRLAGVVWLLEVGSMADADQLQSKLGDVNPQVRIYADAALWKIWSRSGDVKVDKLFARGIEQPNTSELDGALATFSEVVRRKPAFAEGWHRRALVHFLMGQHEQALTDCNEVLKRIRNHFGALSGAGQIHMQMGNAQRALEFFRRAVDLNPNLQGPAQMIPLLEEQLRDRHNNMI